MKLLVCESKDECNLVEALLGARPPDLELHNLRGQGKLSGFDAVVRNRSDFPDLDAIGLLLDAEEDPGHTADAARAFFEGLGRSAPEAGVVVDGPPRVGFFLLPDNAAPGAYETLLRRAAAPDRAACVDALFQCVGGVPAPATTQARRDKVWFHAYAATLGPEARHRGLFGPPPGFDVALPVFDPLRAFLTGLLR